jgi:hypothetical protein
LLHLTLTIRIEFHQITRIVSEPTGFARFHEFELQPHQVQTIQGRVNYPQTCGLAESLRPGRLKTAFPASDLRLE